MLQNENNNPSFLGEMILLRARKSSQIGDVAVGRLADQFREDWFGTRGLARNDIPWDRGGQENPNPRRDLDHAPGFQKPR